MTQWWAEGPFVDGCGSSPNHRSSRHLAAGYRGLVTFKAFHSQPLRSRVAVLNLFWERRTVFLSQPWSAGLSTPPARREREKIHAPLRATTNPAEAGHGGCP